MTIPNVISLARLFCVPVAVWLIVAGKMLPAFWVFVLAGLSDAVDGFIAKQFNANSKLGRYLDPLADKALLVGVYVTLGVQDYLPPWLVILVVFRDFLIIGGALLMHTLGTNQVTLEPLRVWFVNTLAQIALAALVLGRSGLGFDDFGLVDAMIYLVAATTLLSGGAYVSKWTRGVANIENGGK
jgi:cardiolipin synthase